MHKSIIASLLALLALVWQCGLQSTMAQDIPDHRQDRVQVDQVDPDDPVDPGELPPLFDGEAAFATLVEICEIGPRISTSDGMRQQQELIQTRLEELGGVVTYQRFNVRNPSNGLAAELQNMIVRFHPEREKRLLLCCHYDTRPFADRDPVNPAGKFIGANDGASGVALLLELAKIVPALDGRWGIDMVFFDGEEFVFVHRRDPMFLGSTYFAQEYAAGRIDGNYSYGILFDMVADKNLEIFYEKNSMSSAPRLMRSIFAVAKQLGRTEFSAEKRHKIKDDHLPLNSIAKIPTCDIIDFDYPTKRDKNAYWHTQQDIPENCSGESLEAVGSVMREWLIQLEAIRLKAFLLIAAFDDGRLRTIMLLCGVALFVAGIFLMIRHLQHWQHIQANEKDGRTRTFEFRKFRRRGTISCLMSIAGSSMTALYWAEEARVFALLALFLFASLVGILGLAILDLMSVSIRQIEPDDDARQQMIDEYLRRRGAK